MHGLGGRHMSDSRARCLIAFDKAAEWSSRPRLAKASKTHPRDIDTIAVQELE